MTAAKKQRRSPAYEKRLRLLPVSTRADQYSCLGLRVIPVSATDEKNPQVAGFGADAPAFTVRGDMFVDSDHLVAIVCGPCPALGATLGDPTAGDWLLCIDLDGDLTAADLADALQTGVPDTLATHDGKHLWYRVEPGPHRDRLRQWNDVLGIRKAWKADGGHGKAPTADLKWCGGYAREYKEMPVEFRVNEIAVLPVELAEAIIARKARESSGESEPLAPVRMALDPDAVERMVATLVEAWPAEGEGRHDAFLALGGMLRRQGVRKADTESIAQSIVDGTGSDRARVKDAADAWHRADKNQPAYGWTELATHLHGDADALLAAIDEATADPWVTMMIAKWPPPRRKSAPSEPVLSALSPWVRDFVVAQQEEMRTPLALNIGVALGAIAACISGHLKVHIHGTWTTETGLYACCIAPPGKKKSPTLKQATAPIKAWVDEQRTAGLAEYSKKVVERKRQALALSKAEAAYKQMYGSGDSDEAPRFDELIKAQAEWDAGQDPVKFEMLTADATPEKLVDLLAKHGRIACITGEGSKVFNMLSNGSQGKPKAGQADVSAWLDAYDGQLDKVHRIGREAEDPRHKHTTLSALLMVQPVVIRRVVSDPVLCGEGLVPRLTLLSCESDGVRYVPGEIPEPVPTPVAETWDAGLRFLLALPEGTEIGLDAEARRVLIGWRDELEPRRVSGGDLAGVMAGWAEKTEERAVRIAAGLWACDGAAETSPAITGEQMARAVTICRWFVDHALKVITDGQAQAKRDALQTRILQLLGDGPLSKNALRMGLSKPQRQGLDSALESLSKAGQVVAEGDRWALAE